MPLLRIRSSNLDANVPQFAAVASGGAYLLTSNTISSNATISSGYNALSIGPLNIVNNSNVVVSSGSRWLIL